MLVGLHRLGTRPVPAKRRPRTSVAGGGAVIGAASAARMNRCRWVALRAGRPKRLRRRRSVWQGPSRDRTRNHHGPLHVSPARAGGRVLRVRHASSASDASPASPDPRGPALLAPDLILTPSSAGPLHPGDPQEPLRPWSRTPKPHPTAPPSRRRAAEGREQLPARPAGRGVRRGRHPHHRRRLPDPQVPRLATSRTTATSATTGARRGDEYDFGFMIRLRARRPATSRRRCGWRSTTSPARFGPSSIRLTTRQSVQLHFIPKGDLKTVIRTVNDAPGVHPGGLRRRQPQRDGRAAARRRPALRDRPGDRAPRLRAPAAADPRLRGAVARRRRRSRGSGRPTARRIEEEPLYGRTYLPRKFKTCVTVAGDNSRRPVHPRPGARRRVRRRTASSRAGTRTSAAGWAGPTASPTRSRASRTRSASSSPATSSGSPRPSSSSSATGATGPTAATRGSSTRSPSTASTGSAARSSASPGVTLAARPRGDLGAERRPPGLARAGRRRVVRRACGSRTAGSATTRTASACGRRCGRIAAEQGVALPRHAQPEPVPGRRAGRRAAGPIASILADHGVETGDALRGMRAARDGLPGPARPAASP